MNTSKCFIRTINTVLLGLTFAWLGSVDTVRAQSGVWTAKGPAGQEVLALAIDPLTPTTLYAGTRTGGVFKSIDAGENWTAINTGLTSAYIGELVIDPSTPSTLYGRSNGIVKSVDGGSTWTAANNGIAEPERGSLTALAIDPSVPATLYVGTQGALYKTTDGGNNWSLAGMLRPISALAIDPQNSTVYAATHLNGPPKIRKSIDGGATWSVTALDRHMVYSLAIDPEVPTTLYAGACSLDSNRCGVVKSLDGGDSWTDIPDGIPAEDVRALAIDPQTPSTIYAGVSNLGYEGFGVFKSTDGGGSWAAINEGLTNNLDVAALAVDPVNPTIVYAATKSGGVFSRTGDLERFTLTVGTTGDGAGTVSSSPSGIDCGPDCSELYANGSSVTLTAAPSVGSVFTGWNGCDEVSGMTCTVTVAAEASVTAKFDLQRFDLTVAKSGIGRGAVTSSPAGIACGSDCSDSYVNGATVTLTATPALGSIFTGWSGCDAVSGSRCTVVMTGERSVNASFVGIPIGIGLAKFP